MPTYKDIGKISKSEEFLFEWIFPTDWLLTKLEDICIWSPNFRLLGSSWYLTLYPNGHVLHQSKGWIGLFLDRVDCGPPKRIKYILDIDVDYSNKIFAKIHDFSRLGDPSGEPRLLEKTTLGTLVPKLCPNVKITCRIKDGSFTALQGTPNIVSSAIQTEIPDSVSCAIQTEIPDSLSCAIQTDVPDKVINKEISSDQDGSSLDTKEVTILRDRMKQLLVKSSDYDVTICVQDKKFRAHRNILSARSPVFAMMLTHDTKENNTGTISIEDCDPDTFSNFLLYVYSGRMENITPCNDLQLYYTADKYDFPVLKERCVSLL